MVLHIKNLSLDNFFIPAGDFNQWQAQSAVEDYPDIVEVCSPPTKNNRNIDRIFLNWQHNVDAECFPPLKTEVVKGQQTFSDHRVQVARASIDKKKKSEWKKIRFLPYSEAAAFDFLTAIGMESWETVLLVQGSNAKGNTLQAVLDGLIDHFFPMKTIWRKHDDLPWINETALKKIRRKKACVWRARPE